MRSEQEFDYLVRLIYQPRVLIYGLSVIITISRISCDHHSLRVAALCLFLFAYPHLMFWISGSLGDWSKGRVSQWLGTGSRSARYSLLVDGVLVGLLIVANDLHLMASSSFLAALVMSTLVVSGPLVLAGNLTIVLATVLIGFGTVEFRPYHSSQPLTDILSAFTLILYSGLVGYIGFMETTTLVNGRARMNEQRHRLAGMTSRLSKYVSPQLYSTLVDTEVSIATRRKRLTVFFSDIEGFTRLMDRLDEEMVTRLLNAYLDDMAAIALAHGGTIDKFMGDGVMVFFGDPVSRGVANDALACVRMALAMRERLKLLRQKWHGDLHIRIGIHTGYCAVGNFGSEHRMDYTLVGSAVNMASRLENYAGRDEILISRNTRSLVAGKVACTPGVPIRVKGLDRPVEVYRVQGDSSEEHTRSGGSDYPVIRLMNSSGQQIV